ncbi:MAG: phosphoribosyl-ATP diphosphatase [Candidatus Altiarchaeota archaeon]|nr:phosphoribosyl-ATP diphosphatase [Candidatus Altiarchaeota archaeon]
MNTDVLEKLWATIQDRKRSPSKESYTCKMLANPEKLEGKIREESGELIKSKKGDGKDSTRWEAADLIYHLMVYLAAKDVEFDEVLLELKRRMK